MYRKVRLKSLLKRLTPIRKMIECKERMSTRSDKYITMTAMAIFTRWLIAFVSSVTVEEKSIAIE